MMRTYTCILCPSGCDMELELNGKEILSLKGNRCPKGAEYARQEITNPMRNIATSVSVEGGDYLLASVRLSGPIPKDRIFDVMEEIRDVRLKAPVHIGQPVISNVLGLGRDVVATREVEKNK